MRAPAPRRRAATGTTYLHAEPSPIRARTASASRSASVYDQTRLHAQLHETIRFSPEGDRIPEEVKFAQTERRGRERENRPGEYSGQRYLPLTYRDVTVDCKELKKKTAPPRPRWQPVSRRFWMTAACGSPPARRVHPADPVPLSSMPPSSTCSRSSSSQVQTAASPIDLLHAAPFTRNLHTCMPACCSATDLTPEHGARITFCNMNTSVLGRGLDDNLRTGLEH